MDFCSVGEINSFLVSMIKKVRNKNNSIKIEKVIKLRLENFLIYKFIFKFDYVYEMDYFLGKYI